MSGLWEPELGDFLGDLTNEIDGDDYIGTDLSVFVQVIRQGRDLGNQFRYDCSDTSRCQKDFFGTCYFTQVCEQFYRCHFYSAISEPAGFQRARPGLIVY